MKLYSQTIDYWIDFDWKCSVSFFIYRGMFDNSEIVFLTKRASLISSFGKPWLFNLLIPNEVACVFNVRWQKKWTQRSCKILCKHWRNQKYSIKVCDAMLCRLRKSESFQLQAIRRNRLTKFHKWERKMSELSTTLLNFLLDVFPSFRFSFITFVQQRDNHQLSPI